MSNEENLPNPAEVAEVAEANESTGISEENEFRQTQKRKILVAFAKQGLFWVLVFMCCCSAINYAISMIIKEQNWILFNILFLICFGSIYLKTSFHDWRCLLLSHYLRTYGKSSLAKLSFPVPNTPGKHVELMVFPLCSSNGEAATTLPEDSDNKQPESQLAGEGTMYIKITFEAYNKAIQTYGGIPMLFKPYARPQPVYSPTDYPYHGIAIPLVGELEFQPLVNCLTKGTICMLIYTTIVYWLLQQTVLDSMEYEMPGLLAKILLGVHFTSCLSTSAIFVSGLDSMGYRKVRTYAERMEWYDSLPGTN